MLEHPVRRLNRFPAERLIERGMADRAIVADHLSVFAGVLSVVAAEATLSVEMTDVVEVRPPVRFHLGEEVSLIDPLHFGDRVSHSILPAGVNIGMS